MVKMISFCQRKPILVLSIVFMLTVLVRLPNLNRPLSKHHEFNAALILIPMDIWKESSAKAYDFSPVMTYWNPHDKEINNITVEGIEKEGDYYYLSFPSMTYILPYVCFQLFGVAPSPIALQVFNMLIHFICILLIYLIIKNISVRILGNGNYHISAIIGSIIFAFSPTPLWFMGNGYTHHTLVVVFILWAILSSVKLLYENKERLLMNAFQLLVALFFAGMTAWISFILMFILTVFALLKKQKTKAIYALIVVPVISGLASILLTYLQYSKVVGSDTFIEYMQGRFSVRSSANKENITFFHLVFGTFKWYVLGYLPALLLLIYEFLKLNYFKNLLSKSVKLFLLLGLFFVFSHHFLLSEFTIAHNYSVLIDGVIISLFLGLIYQQLESEGRLTTKRLTFILPVLFLSIGQYYFINRPGIFGQNGERYDYMKAIGHSIKTNSVPSDLIFTLNLKEKPNPQVIYYAKRNFHQLNNMSEVEEILSKKNNVSAKVFIIKDNKVDSIVSLKSN